MGDVSGHWTFSLEPEDPQYESHWRLEDGTRVVKDPLFTMCAEDGFNVIKSRLIAGAMLTSPDWTKRFWVACDASLHGYGSVLAQMDEDGCAKYSFYSTRNETSWLGQARRAGYNPVAPPGPQPWWAGQIIVEYER